MPRPTSQDLAGFWDLLQLSVDDVTAKFDELHQIKDNHWQLVKSPEKKVSKHLCCHDNYIWLPNHLNSALKTVMSLLCHYKSTRN